MKDKDMEKIIEKIKKVLELSKNNPSQEEARAAALKAQKLMAEYHISMQEIDAIENVDDIVEKKVDIGTGNKWKYMLAGIIAKNFRCKFFFYGKSTIVFYGYKIDTEIAAETFTFLFKTGNKAAANYYTKLYNEAKKNECYFKGNGIKNSFLDGYMEGIKDGLEKQCTALMIVIPREVEEKYNKKAAGFRRMTYSLNTSSWYANQSREEGKRIGRNTVDSRKISVQA